eukprot:1973585-Pleurochrysis_carterae.AAC.1
MINPDFALASAAPPISCSDTARHAGRCAAQSQARRPPAVFPLHASLPCASRWRSCLIDRIIRPQAIR